MLYGENEMPQHVYLPTRNPLRWFDRLLVHPMDHAAATIAAIYGFVLSILRPILGVSPSESFSKLPEWIVYGSGIFLLAGGILVIAGHHWPDEVVTRGWAIEQGGWILTAGGFVALALAFTYLGAFTGIVVGGALGVGASLRWLSLVLMRRGAQTLVEGANKLDQDPEGT